MLEDLSKKRPEWETAIINHPELGLFMSHRADMYVLKYKKAAYYADFIELQYLVSKMPFADTEICVAMWAYENQLIPYIDTDDF